MNSVLSNERTAAAVSIALVFIFLLSGLLASDFLFVFSLRENAFQFSTLMQLMGPAIIASLFIERAVEIFVSSPRKLKRKEIEKTISLSQAANAHEPRDETVLRSLQKQISQLTDYRQKTLLRAVLFSLSLSFFSALLGVRLLTQFFDIPYIDCLTGLEFEPEECPSGLEVARAHFLWLTRFDIFLTTLILSGGSEGLHSIIRAIIRFAENSGNGESSGGT